MARMQTALDTQDYLRSLRLDRAIEYVHGIDGAALHRVTDEHFALWVCTDPEHRHRGPELLTRIFPRKWICFAVAHNPIDDFEVRHYGPPWATDDRAGVAA